MSDRGTSPNQRTTARAEAGEVLPQWAIELARPLVGFISRLFWQLQQKGTENIPLNGGLIIASNHQAYLDPFLLSLPIKRPIRFLAWNVAFEWPLVGKLMSLLGAWPLQLEGSDPAAIRRSLQWLRDGGAMVIFPEGQRARPDGSMLRFKAGAARIALEAGVPILPVTIRGASRVWPSTRWFPRPGEIEIIYHPLHHIAQRPGEEPRACALRESEKLAAVIGSAL